MKQEKEARHKQFILDSFKARSPVFIVTNNDEWISGYINEQPHELYFYVLDKRKKEVIKIFYARIKIAKEYNASISDLPLPQYITNGEELTAVKADTNVPSDSSDGGLDGLL